MSVIKKADKILNNDRQSEYGDPKNNYAKIALMYNLITGDNIHGKDVAIIMIITKLVREGNKHKEDNLIDLCGYAEILNRLSDD